MHEEMQEYKIILTWEAIYDVTDIADYIEEEFGQQRADRFQSERTNAEFKPVQYCLSPNSNSVQRIFHT